MSNFKVLGGEVLQEVAIAKTLLLRAALLLREVAVAHRFEIGVYIRQCRRCRDMESLRVISNMRPNICHPTGNCLFSQIIPFRAIAYICPTLPRLHAVI